jgi:ArsR family transcriptional regulator
MKRLVPYFRALADSSRLRLLALIYREPICVEDLAVALAVSQPKVSRHLAYLRRAGVVESKRDGRRNYYRIAASMDSFTRTILERVQKRLSGSPSVKADRKRLDRSGPR